MAKQVDCNYFAFNEAWLDRFESRREKEKVRKRKTKALSSFLIGDSTTKRFFVSFGSCETLFSAKSDTVGIKLTYVLSKINIAIIETINHYCLKQRVPINKCKVNSVKFLRLCDLYLNIYLYSVMNIKPK